MDLQNEKCVKWIAYKWGILLYSHRKSDRCRKKNLEINIICDIIKLV